MKRGTFKRTPEMNKRMSDRLIGRKFSASHREKLRIAGLGKTASEETRRKLHLIRKGTQIGEKNHFYGKHHSGETKKKISLTHLGKPNFSARGKNHPCWKGGITPLNVKIRTSPEGILWRKSVFERDHFTCRFCGKVGGELNADHIKPFSLFPELRFAIDNGRTLCVPCHKKVPRPV